MSVVPATAPNEIRIRVAECAVAGTGILSTIGLGSCVAIALYDASARVGGLAHILLPDRSTAKVATNLAKFPDTAVPLMLAQMQRLGASRSRVRAKIVGGASMFEGTLEPGTASIGQRNVEATRQVLTGAGILVEAEDVGGDHGRSVFLYLDDGRVEVRSARTSTRVL
jgi:chemotaxis protein CheD